MRKAKRLLKEMLAGLVVWLIPVLAVLLIIAKNKISVVMGVLLGGAAAVILLLHMYRHIDIALDMDERGARRHTQFASAVRFVIMAAVLSVSMVFYKYFQPIGTVLGIFGVKMAAYLQPSVHKFAVSRGIYDKRGK